MTTYDISWLSSNAFRHCKYYKGCCPYWCYYHGFLCGQEQEDDEYWKRGNKALKHIMLPIQSQFLGNVRYWSFHKWTPTNIGAGLRTFKRINGVHTTLFFLVERSSVNHAEFRSIAPFPFLKPSTNPQIPKPSHSFRRWLQAMVELSPAAAGQPTLITSIL